MKKIVVDLEDCPVSEVSLFRHTVFIDGPAVGLASTVKHRRLYAANQDLGRLHEKGTQELAQLIFSDHLLERAVAWRPSTRWSIGRQSWKKPDSRMPLTILLIMEGQKYFCPRPFSQS